MYEGQTTFLALLLSFYRVLVFLQLLLCELTERIGWKRASVLLILNDESLVERRKQNDNIIT